MQMCKRDTYGMARTWSNPAHDAAGRLQLSYSELAAATARRRRLAIIPVPTPVNVMKQA